MVQSYEQAIESIVKDVTDEVIISSTGMISRELFKLKDRPRNFYMMGSMGMCLAIGLGIAYTRPDLKVIVISGDGAVLMSLGTLVLHKQLEAKGMTNLRHYILDNNAHGSTGGQPTCSNHVELAWHVGPPLFTEVIKITKEKGDAPRIPFFPEYIAKRFKDAIVCK